MLRMIVLVVALAGFAGAVTAQEIPSWIRSQQVQDSDPPPPPPPPGDGDLPDLPQAPIDGGLLWLALAGGGYAAYRLRRVQRDA